MQRCSTNKEAWEILFEKYNILDEINKNGFFKITSKQINVYREARLMTKFDNSAVLPDLFKKNGLSILPVTSNSYMIARFNTYMKFEKNNSEIKKIEFPSYIESLDFKNITSEALAINCSYITKILEDFLEDTKVVPTVSGKMSSGIFEFNINELNSNNNINVEVENSRLEIDGGYEGINSLALIEAKNFISDDFMVRQLYYPYRLWENKISKPVRPIYLVYTNGIFTIYEYEFVNKDDYSSIRLVKSKRYCVDDTKVTILDINDIVDNIKCVEEPKFPFPQADKFERVINLCELLENDIKTKKEITENYAFDERQTNYYTDAARYLGLVEKKNNHYGDIIFSLTKKGKEILKLDFRQRQFEYIKLILEHKVFNETMKMCIRNNFNTIIDSQSIIEIMKKCNLYNLESESTYKRRASTIRGWIQWILELTKE